MAPATPGRSPIEDLVGRWPDPVHDAEALGSLAGDPGRGRWLAAELATSDEWRGMPLSQLMPGLERVSGPQPYDVLSVRSSNALGRGGLLTWAALAGVSPDRLSTLPNFGERSLQDALEGSLEVWARFHLNPEADPGYEAARLVAEGQAKRQEEAKEADWLGERVRTVCAWATETHAVTGVPEALAAAATPETASSGDKVTHVATISVKNNGSKPIDPFCADGAAVLDEPVVATPGTAILGAPRTAATQCSLG